jgi:outer membrane protein assembly factor BamB
MFKLNQIIKSIMFIGFSSLMVTGCGKPQMAFPENEELNSYFTEGINFERQNYFPVDINLPLALGNEESINGTTTISPIIYRDKILFTTRNGHLTLVPLQNLGKDRKTRLSKGTTASPTFFRGRVYIPMELGKFGLRVYNMNTAEVDWNLEGYPSMSSPVVIDNLVIHAGKYGDILGLDAANGDRLWKKNLDSNIFVNLASNQKSIIAVTQDGFVQSFEPQYGLDNWSVDLGESVYSEPLIVHDHVFLSAYSGKLYRFDLHTGVSEMIRDFNINIFSPPSADNEHLFIPLSDGKIICRDLDSGPDLWDVQLDGPVSVPILVTNKYLLIGTSQRKFYIVDKSDGSIVQATELEGRLSSIPLISGQEIFIGYEYNHIALLSPEKSNQ